MPKRRNASKRKLDSSLPAEKLEDKTARYKKILTDLPAELLHPIVSALGLKDREAARAVCKQLLAAERGAGECIDKEKWNSLEVMDGSTSSIQLKRFDESKKHLYWDSMTTEDKASVLRRIILTCETKYLSLEANFNTPSVSTLIDGLTCISHGTKSQLTLSHQSNDINRQTPIENVTQLMRAAFSGFRNVTILADMDPSQIFRLYQAVLSSSITKLTWHTNARGVRIFAKEVMGIGSQFFARGRKDSTTTSNDSGEVYRSQKFPYSLMMLHDGWKTKINRSRDIPIYETFIEMEKDAYIDLFEYGDPFVRVPYEADEADE